MVRNGRYSVPISLKLVKSSGGSRFNYLAAGNISLPARTVSNLRPAAWGNILNVSSVDISSALTQMISVDVPLGQLLVIKSLTALSLNTNSETLSFELEVDGVVVLTYSGLSDLTSISFIGHNEPETGGADHVRPETLTDIEVRSNFKVRLRKPTETSASLSVTYVKLNRN